MSLRTALRIAAVMIVVVLLGFVSVVIVGRSAQAFRGAVTGELARQQMLEKWSPPAADSLEALIPGRLGDMSVTNRNSFETLEGFEARLPGHRGRYVAPTGFAVDVAACRLPQGDSAAGESVAESFRKLQNGRAGWKYSKTAPGRWEFGGDQPPDYAEVWTVKGWLFVFRSDQLIPPPFIRSYLEAVSGDVR